MKSFCIIGLGSFGQNLAKSLVAAERQVMVIDPDPKKVNILADIVTDAVIGDPTNENVLKDCGVRNYDCCVNCFYENLNDSVMVTVILKEMGVKKIVARANSERHKNVLFKLGADLVVFPEQDMGAKLAEMLIRKNVIDYFEIHDDYAMAEVRVPLKWVEKNLIELDLRKKYNLSVISVCKTNGKVILPPSPDEKFENGDVISIIGKKEDVDRIAKKN